MKHALATIVLFPAGILGLLGAIFKLLALPFNSGANLFFYMGSVISKFGLSLTKDEDEK